MQIHLLVLTYISFIRKILVKQLRKFFLEKRVLDRSYLQFTHNTQERKQIHQNELFKENQSSVVLTKRHLCDFVCIVTD